MTSKSIWIFCLLASWCLNGVLRSDDWPQWRGPRRDGVWREDGIVQKLPEKLPIRWRRSIGAGYAGPAVAGGRVYVADRNLNPGEKNSENPFRRDPVNGKDRVLCLDAADGKIIWKHEYPSRYSISYPAGPRATPTVDGGKLYAVGTMGQFFCLEAASGKVLWSKDYVQDFGSEINMWGMSAAPLVVGNKVILLAGGANSSAVVALNKDSGKKIWTALEVQDPGYCPPSVIESGGVQQLIIWTPQAIHSLNPETGQVYWTEEFKVSSALSVANPVFDPKENRLLISAFYNGSRMLILDRNRPAARLLWRGKSDSEIKTDGLHALMCTPYIQDEYIYGVCSYGQLRCLEASSGTRVWETRQPTGEGRWWNAFLVRHENRTFICNEQGELIIARLSPQGYKEISRSPLIEPTRKVRRRMTVWSHPAFANRSIYARNDKEIVCAYLGKG